MILLEYGVVEEVMIVSTTFITLGHVLSQKMRFIDNAGPNWTDSSSLQALWMVIQRCWASILTQF